MENAFEDPYLHQGFERPHSFIRFISRYLYFQVANWNDVAARLAAASA